MNAKQKALKSHRNFEYDVDDFIDRLKEFTGCETDYELSAHFGFKAKNQFGQFRSRGAVSSTGMKTILSSLSGRANFNWLFFGVGQPEIGSTTEVSEEYSEAFTIILKGLGFEIGSPQARELTNRFVEIVNDSAGKLPPEAIQHETNEFISELIKYILNAPKRE